MNYNICGKVCPTVHIKDDVNINIKHVGLVCDSWQDHMFQSKTLFRGCPVLYGRRTWARVCI